MDSYHSPMDAGDVGIPNHGHSTRSRLGLRRSWLGRLLGLGPCRERLVAALDHRNSISALSDDAGEKGHDEGLEHGACERHVLAVHLWNVVDAHRHRAVSARICTIPA